MASAVIGFTTAHRGSSVTPCQANVFAQRAGREGGVTDVNTSFLARF